MSESSFIIAGDERIELPPKVLETLHSTTLIPLFIRLYRHLKLEMTNLMTNFHIIIIYLFLS